MKFEECIKNVSTFLDLKRIATPYVIDYRKLNEEALKNAMQITAPQYYHPETYALLPMRLSVFFLIRMILRKYSPLSKKALFPMNKTL